MRNKMSSDQRKSNIETKKTLITRRRFIKSLSAGGAGLAVVPFIGFYNRGQESVNPLDRSQFSISGALVNTSNSPNALLQSINMDDMKWTEGFWADRFEVARQKLVPHVGEIYMSDEISHAFKNFEIAAGLEEGTHDGPSFHDGDFYKWLEGAASLYASTKDASLDQQMDEIIDVIAQAHRDDGYIYTPVLIAHRNGDTEAEPLQASFETYTMGHLMTAAAVHYRATGKKSLLEVA